MQPNVIAFISLSVLLITAVALVIHRTCYKKVNAKQTFKQFTPTPLRQTQTNLESVIAHLNHSISQSTGKNALPILHKYMGGTPTQIFDKLESAMNKHHIPSSNFSTQGNNFQEPIIYMFNANQTLYNLLASSGFLQMTGIIALVSAWVGASPKHTSQSLMQTLQCSTHINWTDIQTWIQLSGNPNPVAQCILQTQN